jgi:hypothetical protein
MFRKVPLGELPFGELVLTFEMAKQGGSELHMVWAQELSCPSRRGDSARRIHGQAPLPLLDHPCTKEWMTITRSR